MIKQYINRYLNAHAYQYINNYIKEHFATRSEVALLDSMLTKELRGVEDKLTKQIKINDLIQENQKVILEKIKNIQGSLNEKNQSFKETVRRMENKEKKEKK